MSINSQISSKTNQILSQHSQVLIKTFKLGTNNQPKILCVVTQIIFCYFLDPKMPLMILQSIPLLMIAIQPIMAQNNIVLR